MRYLRVPQPEPSRESANVKLAFAAMVVVGVLIFQGDRLGASIARYGSGARKIFFTPEKPSQLPHAMPVVTVASPMVTPAVIPAVATVPLKRIGAVKPHRTVSLPGLGARYRFAGHVLTGEIPTHGIKIVVCVTSSIETKKMHAVTDLNGHYATWAPLRVRDGETIRWSIQASGAAHPTVTTEGRRAVANPSRLVNVVDTLSFEP